MLRWVARSLEGSILVGLAQVQNDCLAGLRLQNCRSRSRNIHLSPPLIGFPEPQRQVILHSWAELLPFETSSSQQSLQDLFSEDVESANRPASSRRGHIPR